MNIHIILFPVQQPIKFTFETYQGMFYFNGNAKNVSVEIFNCNLDIAQ